MASGNPVAKNAPNYLYGQADVPPMHFDGNGFIFPIFLEQDNDEAALVRFQISTLAVK
jgi:hypothetical protein